MEILLLHGLFGSLSHPSIIDAFRQTKVHAPDLLGYGVERDYPTDELKLVDQSDFLAKFLRESTNEKVHVVGHSVGGAVGLLLASEHPKMVQSYTSIEGNMTLKDAFWSAEISTKSIEHIESVIAGYKRDVGAWIEGAGVINNSRTFAVADSWLDNQPASTIRAQAKAVVEASGEDDYLGRFDVLAKNKIPIHLMAGSKSAAGWDLPETVKQMAATYTELLDRGHLMMLENPNEFAKQLVKVLSKNNG